MSLTHSGQGIEPRDTIHLVCELNIQSTTPQSRQCSQSTVDSEGFKGGTRGAPIMPRDAVSRSANVERTGRHKWVNDVTQNGYMKYNHIS